MSEKQAGVGRLVVTLKQGEKIHIGDNITVEVKNRAGKGKSLSMAITAPKEFEIWREKIVTTQTFTGQVVAE